MNKGETGERYRSVLRPLALLVAMWVAGNPAWAQAPTVSTEPLSDRLISYTIDAHLDPDRRLVTGVQTMTWRNPDSSPVASLQFHLYLNAFKPGSTFMEESGGSHRSFSGGGDAGGVRIDSLLVLEGYDNALSYPVDLTHRILYIRPDDDNPFDETVIEVELPEALPPGQTITLRIVFESQLPRVFARTGWMEIDEQDGALLFMVGQWFPKLGVYEIPGQRYVPPDADRGRWNTHQFHANSEFYADFGTYDVRITTPSDYVVGATGIRIDSSQTDSTTTVRYIAEDVHDFAWTASPAYVESTERWRHVDIRFLMQRHKSHLVDRQMKILTAIMDSLDAWVGPYPYTTLTVVDATGGASGMEYPTLFTVGFTSPPRMGWMEAVVAHEYAHQYFYGMLASNEFEEAWLDEGFTQYIAGRAMDAARGPGSLFRFGDIEVSESDVNRLAYRRGRPDRVALARNSWEYRFGGYGLASYMKSAVVLSTLERLVGRPTMDQILREYYRRWSFHHPTTRDFARVAQDVSGQDLSWFFDQFVYGTAVVDYAVEQITSTRNRDDPDDAGSYTTTVVVRRLEDGIFPQTLQVKYADGATERVEWNGSATWEKFSFESDVRAVEAFLDPDDRVWLDVKRLNNRLTTRESTVLARREQLGLLAALQEIFLFLGLLF